MPRGSRVAAARGVRRSRDPRIPQNWTTRMQSLRNARIGIFWMCFSKLVINGKNCQLLAKITAELGIIVGNWGILVRIGEILVRIGENW